MKLHPGVYPPLSECLQWALYQVVFWDLYSGSRNRMEHHCSLWIVEVISQQTSMFLTIFSVLLALAVRLIISHHFYVILSP